MEYLDQTLLGRGDSEGASVSGMDFINSESEIACVDQPRGCLGRNCSEK